MAQALHDSCVSTGIRQAPYPCSLDCFIMLPYERPDVLHHTIIRPMYVVPTADRSILNQRIQAAALSYVLFDTPPHFNRRIRESTVHEHTWEVNFGNKFMRVHTVKSEP